MSMRPEARRQQMKAAHSGQNSFSYLYNDRTAGRAGTKRRARKAERSIVNAGYVIFLALMCIATVLMCVKFLQLKESVTLLNRSNAKLETQLTELRRENDARY